MMAAPEAWTCAIVAESRSTEALAARIGVDSRAGRPSLASPPRVSPGGAARSRRTALCMQGRRTWQGRFRGIGREVPLADIGLDRALRGGVCGRGFGRRFRNSGRMVANGAHRPIWPQRGPLRDGTGPYKTHDV